VGIVLIASLSMNASVVGQDRPESADAADAASESTISSRPDAAEDAEIADRIRSIFAQIDGLTAIEPRVSAGVVTLNGSVPSGDLAARATAVASRIAGVVTVQDRLRRDLDLDTNLTPALTQFREDLRSLLRALPLVGVALAIGATIALLGYVIAGRERWWRWITPNAFMAELVATSVRFVFVVLGLIATLEVLGATALLGAVLGGAGVIGIALGFAVRDTVDNYVSSLMLSLRQPFRANDHVVIDNNEGRVIRLTSRATVLMTLDGNHLRIPNSTVFKAVILNYTRNPERRFQFDLGVDANDDPVAGMGVGLAAVEALEFVLKTPKASAIIVEVGDSNIVLRFFGWVNQEETDFMKGRSLAIQAVKNALEAAGFALPEPIYRLRFDEKLPQPLADAAPSERKSSAKRHAAVESTSHDIAPDAHVEQLVKEERAEAAAEDLLDAHRPIE
jgi:small-conductance mechanosensitive channel